MSSCQSLSLPDVDIVSLEAIDALRMQAHVYAGCPHVVVTLELQIKLEH